MKRLRLALAAAAWLPVAAFARAPHPALLESRRLFDESRFSDVIQKLNGPDLLRMPARDQARAYELLGTSQERLHRFDDALRTYQTGVALFPKDINLLTNLGNLLHHSQLDQEARPYYERILALSPRNAAAHLGLAETEQRLGLLARSAVHYRATLETWGDQADIWLAYGEVLAGQRRFDEALAAVQRALVFVDDSPGRLEQARILWELGRKAEAFEALDRADQLKPEEAHIALQRGLWDLEAGQLDAAEEDAAEALDRSPSATLAYWLRGTVALRRGRIDQARRDFERATADPKLAPFVAAAASAALKELR